MKKYGSLRNFWEGGFVGEGIIKRVKPHIHQVTKKLACEIDGTFLPK